MFTIAAVSVTSNVRRVGSIGALRTSERMKSTTVVSVSEPPAVDFESLRPGEFISFHPPGSTTVYSHRVLERDPDGRITTKGVLSSADPWHLTADDVVGSVRMRWQGVGWLVAAAPILLAGGFLALLLSRVVRPRWRVPVVLVVGAVAVSAAITWYRPLVNAQQLAFAPVAGGGADATYVDTGVLPIRLTAHDGPSVVMRAGQVGTVHVRTVDSGGRLRVSLTPVVPWWWWIVLVGGCFVPAAAATTRPARRRLAASGVVAESEEMAPHAQREHAA